MIGKFVKCNTSGNFGMTLIEMLVAMTIAVILLGGLYGVFRVAHLTVQTADEQVTINQIARVVLDRMTRELRSCYPMWVPVPEDVMQQGAMMGISAQMPTEMPSQVLTFFPEDNYDEQTELDQDSLRFTAAVNDPRGYDEPAYDLAEIAYYIDVDDETPEEGLVRAVGLLPGLVSEEATEEQRKVTVLSDRVWALNFRFYDDETDEWLDTWENLEMLPSAIEITIGVFPQSALEALRAGDLETARQQAQFFTTIVTPPLRQVPTSVAPQKEGEEAQPSGEQQPMGERPSEGQLEGPLSGTTAPPLER